MPNIAVFYRYRDAANYKWAGAAVFSNASGLDEADLSARFKACLEDGEFFVAEQVGVPPLYPRQVDPEVDHGYHEFVRCVSIDSPPTHHDDIADFVAEFERCAADGWSVPEDRFFLEADYAAS